MQYFFFIGLFIIFIDSVYLCTLLFVQFRSPWCQASEQQTSRNLATNTATNITEDDLIISESCVKRLKDITEDGACLRVTVEGGGCSGFQYKFDLDSNINDDDKYFILLSFNIHLYNIE